MTHRPSRLHLCTTVGFRCVDVREANMCMQTFTSRAWARIWRKLTDSLRHPYSYRPEQHYMRGPGPMWRAKHKQ
jgi:hypothetical protein